MTMEDKEIRFWTSVNKLPNFMEQEEWDEIVLDYNRRMDEARRQGIQDEKDRLDAIFQTLEVKDLRDISIYGVLPTLIDVIADLHSEGGMNFLRSRKWDENLCPFDDMWKYESVAQERQQYYNTVGNGADDDRYEQWLDYKASEEFLHGDSGTTETQQVEIPFNEGEEAVADERDVEIYMKGEGYVPYEGNTFIKQEWIDNKQPYERMALPYAAALKMWESYKTKRDMVDAMNAIATYNKNKKEVEEDDDYNF
jgi:hypothetical protein